MSKRKAAYVDKDQCIGCGACVCVCPSLAISMDENGKAQVDEQKCIGCGACTNVCPVGAIKLKDIEE